jgi:hypothetical protein
MTVRTKSINFFCLPVELADLLRPIINESEANLAKLKERDRKYELMPCLLDQDAWLSSRETWIVPKFLMIKSTIDTAVNLVQVYFPEYSNEHIKMGAVSLKFDDASETNFASGQKLYGRIRKAIVQEFDAGVWATNKVHGGQAFYKDLFISPRARGLSERGTRLLSQFGDGNINYSIPDI